MNECKVVRNTENCVHISTVYSLLSLPCAPTEHHDMKAYWGSGAIAPRLLDFGTRWRSVISFTPRPLYP